LSRPFFFVRIMKNDAFTLVEVLIALFIVAVGLFALLAIPIAATKLFVHTADHEQAMFIATSKLDSLEAAETVPANGTEDGFTWQISGSTDAGTDGTIYSINVTWDSVLGDKGITVQRLVAVDASP